MDAEVYPREILAEEEPKYLRRQKPLEIKRRKFGRRIWRNYLRIALWSGVAVAGCWATYEFGHFLFSAPEMALIHPEQVSITGNHYVDRSSVLQVFTADRDRSVLRIPIEDRRRQLESIPWVEKAVVRRSLPNRIQVDIIERTPVAFLRNGNDLALLDSHGVVLDRPVSGDFHFPVVTGISREMIADDRDRRMRLFSGFTQEIESAHAGALESVSEIDLNDEHDVQATLTGLSGAFDDLTKGDSLNLDTPVLVHFGDADFGGKYQTLIENIPQWRATAGHIRSIDLRFNREAVVDADTPAPAPVKLSKPKAAAATSKSRAKVPTTASKSSAKSIHPARRNSRKKHSGHSA